MNTHFFKIMSVIFLLVATLLTASSSLQSTEGTTMEVMVVFMEITDYQCPRGDLFRLLHLKPTNVPYLYVPVTWDSCLPEFPPDIVNSIQSPRLSASAYVNTLNSEIRSFIREATFSNEIVHFEAILNPERADGWFEAPHGLVDYNQERNAKMKEDGYNLAASVLGGSVNDYDVLLVVTNIQFIYGYATSYLGRSSVVVGENVDLTSMHEVLAHEFGHVLTLEHVKMGPYDIVGNSDVLVHYGGWSKTYAGWVPQISNLSCIGGQCQTTTTLDPLERPGNNVLRIPTTSVSDNDFIGYFIECRAKIGYDKNIPKEGVIITKIDTIADPKEAAHIVFPFGGGDYNNAALSPGETFVDFNQKITITYLSKDGMDRCTIKAVSGLISNAPDPKITSGSETVSPTGVITYGSKDIWIDSQKNGWDVYPPETEFTLEGGQAAPSGYGDPFWPEHENRIKFLIRNGGYSNAEDVIVDVYVTQPIMLYIPGVTCDGPELNSAKLIGTIEISQLDKGQVFFGEVPWTPSDNSSAQVTVVIRDYMGELSHANNIANETYAQQNILAENIVSETVAQNVKTKLSEFYEYPTFIHVATNPTCFYKIPFKFQRKVIGAIDRKYWIMDDAFLDGLLAPGQTEEISLASMPPENAKAGDCEEIELELSALFENSYQPVAGMTYKSCVVEASELTCKTPDKPTAQDAPVTMSGNLSPASGGETIALEYTSPGGNPTLQLVAVDKDGRYTDTFKPNTAGIWTMQAFWQGTDKYASAESSICSFIVDSDQPEFILISNAFCRKGPGKDYQVVTGGEVGEIMQITARSKDSQWLYGKLKGVNCWVHIGLGELNTDPLALPELYVPPLLPTPTSTPSICSTYTTEAGCNRRSDICMWATQPTGAGVCVTK